MWPIILLVLAAIVVIFLIVVAMQSSSFRVARSVTVNAPQAAAFEQINDLRKFAVWNPWGKIDPAMKQTYDGPPAGVGQSYSWVGNKNVGEGRMTIVETKPNDLVRIKLEFLKPFAATHTAEFTFVPQGNQTQVTWAMSGDKNFMAKAFQLFMNMDRMIGGQFDKGLADLKTIVEKDTNQ